MNKIKYLIISVILVIANSAEATTVVIAPSVTLVRGGAYIPLGIIKIDEGSNSDFSGGTDQTYIINAPAGFEFMPGVSVFDFHSGRFSNWNTSVTATAITFKYDHDGTGGGPQDWIEIRYINIKALSGAPAFAALYRDGGTAIQDGNPVYPDPCALIHANLNVVDPVKTTGSGNWNDPNIWDGGCVPGSSDNASIEAGYIVTITADVSITELIIKSTAMLDFSTNGVILTIDKTLMVNNGGTLTGSADPSNLLYITENAEMITIDGTADIYKLTAEHSKFKLYGSGTLTIETDYSNTTTLARTYNYISGGLTIKGNIDVSGQEFNNRYGGVLNIGGSIIATKFFASTGENTVKYTGNGAQTIKCPTYDAGNGGVYSNLIIAGSGTKTLESDIDVWNNITINSTLDVSASSYNIRASGNWYNSGTFNAQNGTVSFEWSNAQSITNLSGNETFYNLTIDKSDYEVILNNNITITNLLTLTNGYILSASNKILILETNANVEGANSNSFVKGPISKKTNATITFTFPVGKNINYQPIGLTTQSSDHTTFTAEYFNSQQPYGNLLEAGLDHISTEEYWILNRNATGTPSNATVTLYWNANSGGVDSGKTGDLRVVRWNGSSKWDNEGNAFTTGDQNSGSITSLVITEFSPFTLGAATKFNPLPIELISFNAVCNDGITQINWSTASESNNDYFTVEKAINPQGFENPVGLVLNWETVTYVAGAGNSNQTIQYSLIDYEPYGGISYYRLKQTDFDGMYDYSHLSKVECIHDKNDELIIYPNPVKNELNIKCDFLAKSGAKMSIQEIASQKETPLFKIYDAYGKQIKSVEIKGEYTKINATNISEGIYFWQLVNNNGFEISTGKIAVN
ncbi:MAG: T9SS type A sorting domain-containing protein [Bacteroidota bacterium]